MENYWRFIDRNKTYIVIMSIFILSSCTTDRMDRQMMDESYYSQAAVITGHIANRDVYPNTNEISITLPFYDRVDSRQTSLIYDDEFGFSVLPYAPRTVSMAPFVDHMVICPGDSIHVELDFAELGKVSFSGTGADNNVKMNEFHLKYYLSHYWPSVNKYNDAKSFKDGLTEQLEYHLSRLEAFIQEKNPSKELEALCRKEIEADYYSNLIQGLLFFKRRGENVSDLFRVKEVAGLFSPDCMPGNLFDLSSDICYWLLHDMDPEEAALLMADYTLLMRFLKKVTSNRILHQMLVTHFYNQMLEANDSERFEKHLKEFNETVTYPLLKLNIRDRYIARKAYKQNPRTLSDAILHADRPREGQDASVKENMGLKLLRDIIAENEDKVIYITIAATWCPGSRCEVPFQQELAEDYRNKPLRVVNLYLDNSSDGTNPFATDIETYHLTDEQRLGLDPILHTGRGIPFYILIDKDGVIVDFGEHLRPSIPETRNIIDRYMK
ncbi:MAG: hypothetical protein IJN02_00225 [Bacteroidales bacterium]|nr:hypothetical protein [Bacteroidales bacterium]